MAAVSTTNADQQQLETIDEEDAGKPKNTCPIVTAVCIILGTLFSLITFILALLVYRGMGFMIGFWWTLLAFIWGTMLVCRNKLWSLKKYNKKFLKMEHIKRNCLRKTCILLAKLILIGAILIVPFGMFIITATNLSRAPMASDGFPVGCRHSCTRVALSNNTNVG